MHLDELPHEPPGFQFDARLGTPRGGAGGGMTIPERSALFHYVPGKHMHDTCTTWGSCPLGCARAAT